MAFTPAPTDGPKITFVVDKKVGETVSIVLKGIEEGGWLDKDNSGNYQEANLISNETVTFPITHTKFSIYGKFDKLLCKNQSIVSIRFVNPKKHTVNEIDCTGNLLKELSVHRLNGLSVLRCARNYIDDNQMRMLAGGLTNTNPASAINHSGDIYLYDDSDPTLEHNECSVDTIVAIENRQWTPYTMDGKPFRGTKSRYKVTTEVVGTDEVSIYAGGYPLDAVPEGTDVYVTVRVDRYHHYELVYILANDLNITNTKQFSIKEDTLVKVLVRGKRVPVSIAFNKETKSTYKATGIDENGYAYANTPVYIELDIEEGYQFVNYSTNEGDGGWKYEGVYPIKIHPFASGGEMAISINLYKPSPITGPRVLCSFQKEPPNNAGLILTSDDPSYEFDSWIDTNGNKKFDGTPLVPDTSWYITNESLPETHYRDFPNKDVVIYGSLVSLDLRSDPLSSIIFVDADAIRTIELESAQLADKAVSDFVASLPVRKEHDGVITIDKESKVTRAHIKAAKAKGWTFTGMDAKDDVVNDLIEIIANLKRKCITPDRTTCLRGNALKTYILLHMYEKTHKLPLDVNPRYIKRIKKLVDERLKEGKNK